MILANCGKLGLDPERVTLGEYFEALEAHNDTLEQDNKAPDMERLREFKAARAVH